MSNFLLRTRTKKINSNSASIYVNRFASANGYLVNIINDFTLSLISEADDLPWYSTK